MAGCEKEYLHHFLWYYTYKAALLQKLNTGALAFAVGALVAFSPCRLEK